MRIGKLNIKGKLILAPMVGINCASFRLLCKEEGASLVSTGMIHTNSLKGIDSIIKKESFNKKDRPLSIQLVGSNGKAAGKFCSEIEHYADIIDFNLGCPDKSIIALKAGSYYLKHPEKIESTLSPIIANTNKPVTAKIRIGWDKSSINTLEVINILENLGVAAISIHGRTKEQLYSGKVNLDEIKKAKEKANIPIIGNGDIFKPEDAKAMLDKTGCDFIMLGRGSIGNPSIFRATKELLEKGKITSKITHEDKLKTISKFITYYEKYDHMGKFSELRQQSLWFTKSLHNSRRLRNLISKTKNIKEIKSILNI